MQQWIDKDKTIQSLISILGYTEDVKLVYKVLDMVKKEPCLNSDNCDLLKGYAQKPKHWTDDYKDYYFCPICENEEGVKQGQNYCDCCGQKLFWDEIN